MMLLSRRIVPFHLRYGVRHLGIASRPSADLEIELTAPNGRRWRQPLGLFINNEFVRSTEGGSISTINPYTEQAICSVHAGTGPDIDRAVSAARAAMIRPSWRDLSGMERGRLMMRLAALVEDHLETLATVETLDNGKPITASRGWDVPHLAEVLRYYAGWADKLEGRTMDMGANKMAYTLRQPVGVVGQIIPWNYPLAMAAWKLGPALCCGNAVVLKPAEQTPLSALYMARLIREAGFPPGVVNIVNGTGAVSGRALVEHRGVDKIAFTGSTAAGKEVMRAAAGTMKGVTLETGGKSPLIIFDDADLAQAVRWAHEGVMANQGQVCTATSKILVQADVYDDFVSRFRQYTAERSVLGDPFDEATFQGPQVSERQRRAIESYIEAARAEGVTVHHALGPGRPLPSTGSFVAPTIFTDADPESAVFREEIFGPCAVVARFTTEQEAVDVANDSRYGLAGAVFTKNLGRAHRVARALEAGMVWVNSSNDSDVRVPFGGIKESGIGRELGEEGLRGYYNVKAVHVNLSDD